MERIYFPSFDGEEISLLLPRPEAAEARPCVVFLHGGAWRFGLADSYTRHVEYAVSRGAVGVSVEYRLATEGRTVPHCMRTRRRWASCRIKSASAANRRAAIWRCAWARRRLWPIRWPDPITSSTSTARST